MSHNADPRIGDSSTVLYLVRHGETEHNRRGLMQGRGVDGELNATGRAQSQALAQRLEPVSVDALYASTLQRAKQTADIVARPHEPLSRTYMPELSEMDWGVYEGEPPSPERKEAMKALKSAWRNGAYDRAAEGGESIRDVQERAQRALRHILAQEAGRTVLVVSHGRYLRVLLATLLDDYGLEDMQEFGHSNTCVNRVVCGEERSWADLLNCTAHLQTDDEVVSP